MIDSARSTAGGSSNVCPRRAPCRLMPGALSPLSRRMRTRSRSRCCEAAQQIAGVVFSPDEQRRLLELSNGAATWPASIASEPLIWNDAAGDCLQSNPSRKVDPDRAAPTAEAVDAAVSMPTFSSNEALAFSPSSRISFSARRNRQVTPTARSPSSISPV